MTSKKIQKTKQFKEKALLVLQTIAEDESLQFGTDEAKLNTPYAKFVSLVYRLAHSATDTSCKHLEWENEVNSLYTQLEKQ